MSGLTHNVSAQADELLDHIYEYGTNSEGVIPHINQLCDAAVSDRHEMQECRSGWRSISQSRRIRQACIRREGSSKRRCPFAASRIRTEESSKLTLNSES